MYFSYLQAEELTQSMLWPSLRAKQSFHCQWKRPAAPWGTARGYVRHWFKGTIPSTPLCGQCQETKYVHNLASKWSPCWYLFSIFPFSCKLQSSLPFHQATLSLALNDVLFLLFVVSFYGVRRRKGFRRSESTEENHILVGQTAPVEGATMSPLSQNSANSFPSRSRGNLFYGCWVEASTITDAAGPSAQSGSAGRPIRDSWRSRCSLNGVPPALPTPEDRQPQMLLVLFRAARR